MIFKRDSVAANPFRIKVRRQGFENHYFTDIYHFVLSISWLEFFLINTTLYLCMNMFFAGLYYMGGDSILNADPNSYWDAFIFSFQTSSTIGYGHFLPATQFADVVVILDTLSGIIFVAITTGLAFAKFSRPVARVVFTEKCVIHKYEGKKTLMFRVANARDSHIADASIEAVVVMSEKSEEGVAMQRLKDLKLVRSKSPMFFMSWTVMHVIDENSPLQTLSWEDLVEKKVRIVISLTGIDDWSSQFIHSNHLYRTEEITHGYKYADILSEGSDGSITMDYRQFNKLVSLDS